MDNRTTYIEVEYNKQDELWLFGVEEMRDVYTAQLVMTVIVYLFALVLRLALPYALSVAALFCWLLVRDTNYRSAAAMIEEMRDDVDEPIRTREIVRIGFFFYILTYVFLFAALLSLILEVT